jgi:2-polyprenyl-6-methoxyphenol hydroxylase-like FAD-dependent oxidoreductase
MAAMWTTIQAKKRLADQAWLEEYHRKREEDNKRMRDLEVRFKGNKPVTSW